MNPERQQDEQFLERLKRHPGLKERMSSILDLVENSHGDAIKADAAEKQALEAVRQLGNEVLHDWADRRIEAASEQLLSEEERVERNGKKAEVAYQLWGDSRDGADVSQTGATI